MNKLTYVSALEKAINGELTPEVVEKLTKLKDNYANKSGANRKLTRTQEANIGIKQDIVDGMARGERYTITDLIKTIPKIADYSNQKISALTNQLVEAKVVKREEDGRKTYFSLA